ncbi:MAG: c-type cytochrome biogenesis protein CcmI [Rhizobiales bacterium]|nr:c-type cytochrome biogenesis protein CcmI [Hyphomicrobiales bacterium]
MTIWVIFAFLTATVMAGLLLPVLRRREGPAAARADYDLAVFRDQLAELERDAARGAIAPAEAQAAGNEIARRLIAASAPAAATPSRRAAPIVALAGALLIPVIALPLYLSRGRPALPDVPYAERLANAVANRDFDALVAKVEAHLVKQPDDIAGWKVLAPAYRQAQRWDDAARAFKRIIELSRPDAGTFSDYGEMLVFANQGMVAAEAAKAFADALKIEPKLPTARFFAAVALKQEGKT